MEMENDNELSWWAVIAKLVFHFFMYILIGVFVFLSYMFAVTRGVSNFYHPTEFVIEIMAHGGTFITLTMLFSAVVIIIRMIIEMTGGVDFFNKKEAYQVFKLGKDCIANENNLSNEEKKLMIEEMGKLKFFMHLIFSRYRKVIPYCALCAAVVLGMSLLSRLLCQ